MEAQNVETVKTAYAAFGRGDIAGVIATLNEDVEWRGVIGGEGAVPTAGLRRGRDEVRTFFQQVAEAMTFQSFDPREFIAEGDKVAVVGRYKGQAKSTGKAWDAEWVMVFTMHNGKISGFREFTDTRQVAAAFA
jgi:uncharacterized protein